MIQAREAAPMRTIVIYKFVKGGLEFVLAGGLVLMITAGLGHGFLDAARGLRHHFIAAWSGNISRFLLNAATPRRLEITCLALTLDGTLTLVEGWALLKGFAWGRWLVILATSALLPFEVLEIAVKMYLGRVLVFLVNLLIVAYLTRVSLHDAIWDSSKKSRA